MVPAAVPHPGPQHLLSSLTKPPYSNELLPRSSRTHDSRVRFRGWITAGLWLALLCVTSPARAAGLGLSWVDCRAPLADGRSDQTFGCNSNIAEFPLFPMLHLSTALDSVIAVELVIDVDVAADPLPAWWRMDLGQCHQAGWSADAAPSTSCLDPWQGQGSGLFQGWLPGEPGASGRHGRLLVAAVAAPGTLGTLDADSYYTLCRVLLRSNNTLTCEGCSTPACLVFNSVLVRRLPGSVPEEVLFSGADVAGSDRVFWQQGTGTSCGSVPVRRATWGAVKALYR